MKKYLLSLVFSTIILGAFSQRFEVETSTNTASFKRHFTYSIEGGFVDNLPQQFVTGNESDFLLHPDGAELLQGNSIAGNIIYNGKVAKFINSQDEKMLLTDFVVPKQGGNALYAYGTGVYFLSGGSSSSFPFFAVYERKSMEVISMVYYNLLYPGVEVPRNTAATRIKYSEKENVFYISGIMSDQVFADMNFSDIQGRSRGFILKIDPTLLQAQVIVFTPDVLPTGLAQVCSVNDIEINERENAIYFTGVTAEDQFTGYIHPMVGMIDMNLNLQWCYAYDMPENRFSGIDVEFGEREQSLFVLMNAETYPFSIMELDLLGSVIQNPELYEFKIAACGSGSAGAYTGAARGHILHFTDNGGLKVTGNCYILVEHDLQQHLFAYDIPAANNLGSGNGFFGSYSCDAMPPGSQPTVTAWWAPENSIYKEGNLSLVGHYATTSGFGYVYVNVAGFDSTGTGCYQQGTVQLREMSSHQMARTAYATQCNSVNIDIETDPWIVLYTEDCSTNQNKAMPVTDNSEEGSIWKYAGMDETGIHGYLTPAANTAEIQTHYEINVFDLTGRKVYSVSYTVVGEQYIHLKFNAGNQLYLINVSDGTKTETLKVHGIR